MLLTGVRVVTFTYMFYSTCILSASTVCTPYLVRVADEHDEYAEGDGCHHGEPNIPTLDEVVVTLELVHLMGEVVESDAIPDEEHEGGGGPNPR